MLETATIAHVHNPSLLDEKIDLTRFIQPHGILLVLQESDFKILQASQNTHYFLQKTHEELLGQNLEIIFGESPINSLKNILNKQKNLEDINPIKLSATVQKKEIHFDGIIHRVPSAENLIILELEPSFLNKDSDFFRSYNLKLYNLIRLASKNINKQHNFKALCHALVQEIQKITTFDRVMLYKFDVEGHGQVIAESIIPEKQTQLASYFGLHFPNTDIPPLSKELFLTNSVRLITDLNSEPVEILPHLNPLTNQPTQLNNSVLRGVSACHIEYLKNMGIAASLCISLVKEDALWGMIVCHHQTPKYVSYQIRKACEFLGEIMISQPLDQQERVENKQYQIEIQNVQSKLIELAVQSSNFAEGLMKYEPNLLDICQATGAIFWHNHEYSTLGITPPESAIIELINILKQQPNFKLFHTNYLAEIYDQAETIKHIASGLLAIAISPNQYILWFRPEVIQTVEWAGNPQEAININDEKLSPRKSFETWKQTVCLKSLPWKNCEIEAVTELRKGLIRIVLRQIDELSRLNQALRDSEAKAKEKSAQLEATLLELQTTQMQLIQSEKMSLLGQMIAGIAHEINNPISFIKGNISHAKEYINDLLDLIQLYQEEYPNPTDLITEEMEAIDLEFLQDDLPKMLNSMKMGTERITKIINSLRNFSRLDSQDKHQVDLHEGIDSTLMILNHRLKALPERPEIKIMKNYGELPLIDGYGSQLNQVFMNILANAIDALDEVYEKNHNSDNLLIEITTSLINQEQVLIKIKDSGIGMPPEVKAHIFDNYFTTKPVGKGTGFGLTISYQIIVENHQGELICESSLNRGTEFLIKIPI